MATKSPNSSKGSSILPGFISGAKPEKKVQKSSVLACRQWWKVCFMYGSNRSSEQYKLYRQLYGRNSNRSNNKQPVFNLESNETKDITELTPIESDIGAISDLSDS